MCGTWMKWYMKHGIWLSEQPQAVTQKRRGVTSAQGKPCLWEAGDDKSQADKNVPGLVQSTEACFPAVSPESMSPEQSVFSWLLESWPPWYCIASQVFTFSLVLFPFSHPNIMGLHPWKGGSTWILVQTLKRSWADDELRTSPQSPDNKFISGSRGTFTWWTVNQEALVLRSSYISDFPSGIVFCFFWK